MLQNKKLKLRYFEANDIAHVMSIRSSQEAYNFFFEFEPCNQQQQTEWWEQSFRKNNEKNFIIVTNDEKENFLGTISLVGIDMRNKKAELGRFYLHPLERGKGYGVEIIALLLEYSFNHLNLHKIYLEVLSENIQAINLYKKLGFCKEGLLKNHIFKNGKYQDIQIYSIFTTVHCKANQ